ncbi:MAG: esterase-like activity of phytase family protein [Phycisphaerales bacterium]|nr:esterase-like activity of phytase family protein [Phycisphaerales bacterium]
MRRRAKTAHPRRMTGPMPVRAALFLLFPLLAAAADSAHAQLAIAYADTVSLPSQANDQHGQPFTIAGLSGVTWLGNATYAAAMDNSNKLVFFELQLSAAGAVESLTNVRGLTLARSGDHEGICLADPAAVLISDEAASVVRKFSLIDGALIATLDPPTIYTSRRANLGLESLSFDPDFAWTANEEALRPDGPRATPDNGTTVRLLRLQTATGLALSELAYAVEPMHGPNIPFGNPGQSGLSDLVALPDGSLLALERSLAFTTPFFLTRIYLVGFANAEDVSHLDALEGASFTPVSKKLLYQGGHNNLEGLCLGPRLSPTAHALVGVVDDGDPLSGNTVVVLRLTGLQARAADTNGDGRVDIDDLYHLHQHPVDLNGDGVADGRDRAALEAYLRRHERFDALRGQSR